MESVTATKRLMIEPDYLSVNEIADRWQCKPSTVWQKIESGSLIAELVLDGKSMPVRPHIAAAFSTTPDDYILADPQRSPSEPVPIFSEGFPLPKLAPRMVRVRAQAVAECEAALQLKQD